MTRRRTLHASSLPALHAFARAYLHQDLLAEHGGAEGAADAFARDASEGERRELVDELARLERAGRRWPLARLAQFFSDELGAAWAPESATVLRMLIERLRRAS
jgi:hypothetical protein